MFDKMTSHYNSFLKSLLDEVTDIILIATDSKILFANKKLYDLLFIDPNINFPCSFEDFFEKRELEKLVNQIKNQIHLGAESSTFNTSFQNQIFKVETFSINQNEEKLFYFIFKPQNEDIPNENFTDLSKIFPFILIEIDKYGKILSYNQQFELQLFYNEKDFQKGLFLHDIVTPGSKPVIESMLNNFKEFEKSEKLELKIKNKNWKKIPIILYYKSMLDNKNFLGYRCFIQDISERKLIESKYRKNQVRLRRVIDLVPHMISLKDQNGKILLANKACADFYKTTVKNLVYSNITDFHHSTQECKEILKEDKNIIQKKEKSISKTVIRTDLEGNQRVFESSKIPFSDPESEQVHSLGILMDITDKKRVEKEIEETKEKYRLLVERGSDGILIIQDENIVFANNQASKILGQTIEKLINQPLNKFIGKGQLKKAIEEYSQDTQNKEFDNFYDLKIDKPDNDITYIEAKLNTINYEGKKSRIVFIRDVTKRKIAERRSERDKNMLEQAQKITQLGSWDWDLQKRTLSCSEEICRIVEDSLSDPSSIHPKWLSSFIPHHEKSKVLNQFFNSLRNKEHLDIEFPIVTRNGERKIIHAQSKVFSDRNGKPERVIGTWIDISERIRIEQMLKEAKLKAEESDKLKSAFLANMSHEIRTPMNAILGFANMLKEENIENDIKLEYIDHIQQSGEGLLKLINDIIDISKIESNQIKIECAPVYINEILDQLYNRYEELLILNNRDDIRFSLEKALPDPNFAVITDAFRLQQVISNLLNNSLKFTLDGEIKFGYYIANSELCFFVQDQGVGIPDDKRGLIFERFGKLDSPPQMNKSGTGLGLSISKSLVNLMGGRIWLDSGAPRDTRFCFTIPFQTAKISTSEKENKPEPCGRSIDLKGKTILIAEDELLNYKLLETLIKKTGAIILWAKNGLEAINFVKTENVDLIFMDIKMPEMNGYEATKAIKKMKNNIPIVAQTAFAFSNERQFILQSGCDMYLTKPINHKDIYTALNYFLT